MAGHEPVTETERDQRTATGNPAIDRWIAEGRIVPAAVPGTVLDLLPLPAGNGSSIADEVIAERDA